MVLYATFCRGFSRPNSSHRRIAGNPLRMVLADFFSTSIVTRNDENQVLDPLIVCGPSGVGKGTIIAKFMEEMGGRDQFGFTVSHTTRQPREGEVNGVHYHFVDIEDMKQQIQQGAFLEFAEVHGNFYGTSLQSLRDVQDQGKRCLLDIDVEGVRSVKNIASEMLLEPKYLFIAPPSFDALKERLVGRGTETPESLSRRTANAKAELEYGTPQNFDSIVVNNDLDVACQDFAEAVRKMYDL
ncbi:unnamed protein product [Cylindrotheca closterium]|uniref:guanylate kinase n=1 Tax=Cylindrotheca closterium TaxID=2856 RepID=A0AAD2FAJ3_9STRA|nr:unnamed protein product [Cylindrotheca closterium]